MTGIQVSVTLPSTQASTLGSATELPSYAHNDGSDDDDCLGGTPARTPLQSRAAKRPPEKPVHSQTEERQRPWRWAKMWLRQQQGLILLSELPGGEAVLDAFLQHGSLMHRAVTLPVGQTAFRQKRRRYRYSVTWSIL